MPAAPEDCRSTSCSRPRTSSPSTCRSPTRRATCSTLVSALAEGRIAGAALDVFEHEPDVHPGLLELENVVLVPHLGSATLETREAMGMLCVEALRAVLLEGRVPANAVS